MDIKQLPAWKLLLDAKSHEMKRLYVQPQFHENRIGKLPFNDKSPMPY